jgi:hypothetical protein
MSTLRIQSKLTDIDGELVPVLIIVPDHDLAEALDEWGRGGTQFDVLHLTGDAVSNTSIALADLLDKLDNELTKYAEEDDDE